MVKVDNWVVALDISSCIVIAKGIYSIDAKPNNGYIEFWQITLEVKIQKPSKWGRNYEQIPNTYMFSGFHIIPFHFCLYMVGTVLFTAEFTVSTADFIIRRFCPNFKCEILS